MKLNAQTLMIFMAAVLWSTLPAHADADGGSRSMSPPSSRPTVLTASGAVRGTANDTIAQFLGLPYAAAPTGALRWRAPRPPAHWSGIRDATRFGPDCAQNAGPFGQASTAQDCLDLNVYTPRQAPGRADRPVMVWIHGGGFQGGAGRLYDPSGLVRHGVVVVTVNYRLGALGFLADQGLADAHGNSGDYGLMDQQAALRWVARNIGGFGGDPHNVTLFGESSGGASVLAQMASPQARTLFQRAIVESGAYTIDTQSQHSAEAAGAAFAAKIGCPQQQPTCLRDVPTQRILAAQASQYVPTIDPDVLPISVRTAFTRGHVLHVPLIDGTNHDEGRLTVAALTLSGHPVTARNYLTSIRTLLSVAPGVARRIAAAYPLYRYPDPPEALAAADTDDTFVCPSMTIDEAASRHAPTYGYEFNDPTAPEVFLPATSFPYASAHASELQYLFTLPFANYPAALSPQQQQLAELMRTYWTTFAAIGRPEAGYARAWQRFTASQPESLVLSTHRSDSIGVESEHHCGFWGQLSST